MTATRLGRNLPGDAGEGEMVSLHIAFDDPASVALQPRRVSPGTCLVVCGCWRFAIRSTGTRARWVTPYLVDAWRPEWVWEAAEPVRVSSMDAAVLHVRRLMDAGMDPAATEAFLRERAQATWRFDEVALYRADLRRFELAIAIQALPAGQVREVAIALADTFTGTPTHLADAARAITA